MTSTSDTLRPPEPITSEHDTSSFNCGELELDDWLRRRALKNQEGDASRTYVVSTGMQVVGYYTLAAGAVSHAIAPGKVRRNMPEPIPVMVLGRLAVDRGQQGRGIGRALLRDALLRTMRASEIIGIRAILVHAISESARQFYLDNQFTPSPSEPMTLLVTLKEIREHSS